MNGELIANINSMFNEKEPRRNMFGDLIVSKILQVVCTAGIDAAAATTNTTSSTTTTTTITGTSNSSNSAPTAIDTCLLLSLLFIIKECIK